MQKTSTCLWFDNQAEEAVAFYTSLFKDSTVGRTLRSDENGTVIMIEFELEGRPFMALNGGPMFGFTEAVSIVVYCNTQEEIDHYWNKLTSNGGEESMCGWLKDKYGLSWQIVPPALIDMHLDKDREKARRAMQAMMQMRKLDIGKLQEAFAG